MVLVIAAIMIPRAIFQEPYPRPVIGVAMTDKLSVRQAAYRCGVDKQVGLYAFISQRKKSRPAKMSLTCAPARLY